MAALTYFEIVEDIINDLDSDVITTILETEESRQVVKIVEQTYYEIIDSREWPHLLEFSKLTAGGVVNPAEMVLPTTTTRVKYIKYDTSTSGGRTYTLMKYLEPQAFMNVLDARDSGAVGITEFADSVSGIGMNIVTNAAPSQYTLLGNNRVIFDAYDGSVDAGGLVASKTQVYGQVYPTVTVSDSFVFSLPIDMFSYLLEEAKSTAFLVLKQANNPKADFRATSLRATHREDSWKIRRNYPIKDRGVDLLTSGQQNQGNR